MHTPIRALLQEQLVELYGSQAQVSIEAMHRRRPDQGFPMESPERSRKACHERASHKDVSSYHHHRSIDIYSYRATSLTTVRAVGLSKVGCGAVHESQLLRISRAEEQALDSSPRNGMRGLPVRSLAHLPISDPRPLLMPEVSHRPWSMSRSTTNPPSTQGLPSAESTNSVEDDKVKQSATK